MLNRRDFIKAGIAGGLSAGLMSCSGTRQQPNIVLIMADDLGYECIGANGGTSYKTPDLDRLAGEGVRFEHCYAQPLCTPSRVKIMTGKYNVRNYVEFGILDEKETTFANIFRNAGYKTCIAGKWQLKGGLEAPGHFGFDEYCLWQLNRIPGRYPNPGMEINSERVDFHNGEYGPDIACDYAIDFMERNRDRPFLLYYPMILTHSPFEPTPLSPDYDLSSRGAESYLGDPKYFGDMVSYMDRLVGRIDRKLKSLGIRKNTVMMFLGDNGTDTHVVSRMGEKKITGGKRATTDAGTRVPMIANWPGVFRGGSVCSDIIDLSDFLPTMCECAGISPPDNMVLDGRSFLPQMKGEAGNPRDWIYIWFSRSGDRNEALEFTRNQRYKLYRSGEFYDIAIDPLENTPLDSGSLTAEQSSVKRMLQQALDRFRNARPDHLK